MVSLLNVSDRHQSSGEDNCFHELIPIDVVAGRQVDQKRAGRSARGPYYAPFRLTSETREKGAARSGTDRLASGGRER